MKQYLAAPTKLIADRLESATILFTRMVSFNAISATMPPEEVITLLTTVTNSLDAICEEWGGTKIKTLGDTYMVVVGMAVAEGRGRQGFA